ncbi:hypothetical protein MTP99_013694 [Tenebrio molitor]|nr:hypothetical protein MTP99_013694 [Tenebrio molitor]
MKAFNTHLTIQKTLLTYFNDGGQSDSDREQSGEPQSGPPAAQPHGSWRQPSACNVHTHLTLVDRIKLKMT